MARSRHFPQENLRQPIGNGMFLDVFEYTYTLRIQVPHNLPLVPLSADGATWSFLECIKSKSSRGQRLSDATKLKNYVAYHRQSCRQAAGKLVYGAYVENEMICAVSHQNNLIINVAHAFQPELAVITPDGSFIRFDDDRAERSPFFLWCTGGHYQAILKLEDVEVLSSALRAPAFLLGNVLNSDVIRRIRQ
jgi:hypothetical protein